MWRSLWARMVKQLGSSGGSGAPALAQPPAQPPAQPAAAAALSTAAAPGGIRKKAKRPKAKTQATSVRRDELVIFGLGNGEPHLLLRTNWWPPTDLTAVGEEYTTTRHNAGFLGARLPTTCWHCGVC